MYTITVNGSETMKADLSISGNHLAAVVDGKEISGDFLELGQGRFHLLVNDRSYRVRVLKHNREEKSFTLSVNSERYELSLKDKYDELLHRLGMDNLLSARVNDIKAPMPGMVLRILVNEGDQVKKGDALIVLEAMKMENILKAPGDGTVKKIAATKGSPVEKNQLLIQF